MVFNSLIFIFLFLPLILLVYYTIKDQYRVGFLIIASFFFYAYNDGRLTINFMLFIVITYAVVVLLDKTNYNRWVLRLGVTGLVGYLIYFKYLYFLTENINLLLGYERFELVNIAFPLGVSFFTFSAISYLIDCYRSKQITSFIDYVHFISFFPKLINGPLATIKDFNYTPIEVSDLNRGISRFVIGLSKKVIFAYYFGLATDSVWDNFAAGIDVPTAWIGAIVYSLQIYFDFSGYSDMAIGLGQMFGYRLPENFNFPYVSTSISEYWRRWHMTLGKWFGRYVYIPLGGSRTGNVYINLLIVFLVSGAWHGANWTFIVWGLWHAIFRLIEQKIEPMSIYQKIPSIIKWIVTMIILLISRVIFRSIDIEQAIQFSGLMFGIGRVPQETITFSWEYFLNTRLLIIGVVGILGSTILEGSRLYHWWQSLEETDTPVLHLLQTVLIAGLAVICVMMIISSEYSPFIYFRF